VDRRLLRVLGVGFGLAVTIGNTIGAGIFRAPGEVARHLPDTWLFLAAWTAGAIAGDTRNSLFALLLLSASYPLFHMMKTRS
jgi:hypothetical protein